MKYLVTFILLQLVMFNNGILQAQWVKTRGPAYEKQVNSSTTILSNGWILVSELTQQFDTAWVNAVQTIYTHDENGYLTVTLRQTWGGSGWDNFDLDSFTNDGNGYDTLDLFQSWNNGAWVTTGRYHNSYDVNGNNTRTLAENWSSSGWVTYGQETWTYNANGKKTSDLAQTWNGSTWVNAYQDIYTYDANGYRIATLYQTWNGSAWVNASQDIYTYDANGYETIDLSQTWSGSAWGNSRHENFTYDANGKKASELYQTWSGSAWVNSMQWNFTFDGNGNNTNLLEQVWEKSAWVNSQWLQYNWQQGTAVKVTSPSAGETVLAGEPYTISWQAPGITFLRIDFSTDSGNTYKTIAGNVIASANNFTWTFDDTILSAKCKIKISDKNDTTKNGESGRFRIKPYILTRFKPNGDYEKFDILTHAWSFGNSQANMWPASWFNQFDYEHGTDPYTAQHYPQNLFRVAPVWAWYADFPDWPNFVRAFGADTCYVNTSPVVYSPSAFSYWAGIKGHNWNGSCFGFAISSLLNFDFPAAFSAYFPELGNFTELYSLPINDSTRRVVNQLFQYQFGSAALDYRNQAWHKTPRQTLQDLKNMFLSDIRNDQSLYIVAPAGNAAHSIVPTEMHRIPNTSQFRVKVYDNRCPEGDCGDGFTNPEVIIDSAFNTWSYAPLQWGSGNWGLLLEAPVNTFLNPPIIPTGPPLIKNIPPAALKQTTTSYLRVLNTTTSNITITDSIGNTIGFHDTTGFCTLTDGFPIIPATANFQPPIGYYIPGGSYSINMDSFKDSAATLSVFGSSNVFSYWRSDAAGNQSDRLSYKNGINVGNPDAQTKSVNLEAITKLIGSEHEYQILNCATVQNDSVRIATPDSNRIMFVNMGPSKIYDLNIMLAGVSSSGQFTHARISVPAHSTHFIVPNWQDLSHQPVKIYLDNGNTGTISDSLLVTNEATGIKEQSLTGIPGEFSLGQNFPNPFNPTTTIRYGMPNRSHVTLTVFNTLGQQVVILQNGEQDAGFHEVQFNGSRLASGVYFYSIEVNSTNGKQNFRETRKMLLLK